MKVFSKALQGKIFLITSVTICVLVGIFFIIEFNHDKKILYERQIMHMKEASHTVRNSIESVRIPLLIQSILDEYAQNIFTLYDTDHSDSGNTSEKEAHQLHVVNTDSIIMASTKSEYIGLPLEEAILHKEEGLNKVLKGEVSYSIEQMEHAGVEVIDVSVPIREKDTIIGALHYVEPYLKLERLIRESFIRNVLFAITLIVSLSIIINFFLSKMVSRPIKLLSNAMDEIRLKRRSREVDITTDDEIGNLALSFNEMSKVIKEREEEVNRYTTSLKEMVSERTKELREKHLQLVQTERLASMGKLADYIAHEINNPIGIIVSRSDCILMDAKEKGYSDVLTGDIEVIKKHSDRIAKITKGMLSFSRKAQAEFSDVDINLVIEESLSILEKQFHNNDIEVKKEFACDIPTITGNSTQLQQVIMNILSNAVDSMQDGGNITILCHCKDRKRLHVIITDTGSGIEKEYVDKIFEPFFTTKTESKGTGLGLSVSHGIIKDHEGRIRVQSKKGEGTTFDIELPLKNKH